MRFAPTDEQQQLREVARAFLTETPAPEWDRVVEEQGWQAIAIPEEYGGFGFGFVELALVAEEIGRFLAPVPILATCGLAATAIEHGGTDDQKERWLSAIAGGSRAALALHSHIRAVRSNGGFRLVGEAARVIDGATAELLVLPTDEGLFVVERDQVRTTPLTTMDPTRPLATVSIDAEVPEDARLPAGSTQPALEHGWVLLAAEAVGAAEACLDETVAYAKVRTQFGKAIGTFQAIQHTCAEMLLKVESARSAAWYAAWAVDAGAPDRVLAARTARAYAGTAAFEVAGETIQCHGGIGFTWEHMAHRYFKRARCDRQLLGTPTDHLDAVATELLGAV